MDTHVTPAATPDTESFGPVSATPTLPASVNGFPIVTLSHSGSLAPGARCHRFVVFHQFRV